MNAVLQVAPKIDGYHTVVDPDSRFRMEWRVGYEITQYGRRDERNPWDAIPHEVELRTVELIPYDGHGGYALDVDDMPSDAVAEIEVEIADKLDEEMQ